MASESDGAWVADEEWLLQRCRHGDTAAFAGLASGHLPAVYSIAVSLSATRADAARLTRRALWLVWQRIPSMPVDLPFRIFVRRAVVGVAVERLRRAASAAASLEAFLPSFDRNGAIEVPADGVELASLFDRPDMSRSLQEALGRLDADDRAAFVLRHIEQLALPEAAAILEMPADKVRKGAHRACSMLSGYLRQLARRSSSRGG